MSEQKLALVTGASRGFGAAVAEELAVNGWHVIAVARTTGALEELDDRIKARGGEQPTLAPMDVTDPDAMRHLCRSVHDRWGKLDLWVHTAIHVPPLTPADHLDVKDWTKVVTTGVQATGVLIPFVSPLLIASGAGTAVFVDDPNAGKFLGAYAAAKSAQRALFDAWAQETAKTGQMRVHRFAPAPMPTATRARFYPGEDRSPLTQPADEAQRLLAELG
ncbi:SDR family NAD(P)-dependent oxidoreductase [Actibacterium sp. XHP0104]|uniref:SDR family NAD(P)-dependent oxidoreductase n=1 Tax=Actibacterium sp. XHP0104 TaxID=2984335 RepID=UPI0021E7C3D7|nr:SDR family oxidoreductase [Actibacterium sp. XHP0104]MCV2880717.1 SDR family oxidoreductase [Actibacterium sp. XHP0104]